MKNSIAAGKSEPFDPFTAFSDKFTIAGDVFLDACPVCDSRNYAALWKLPQNKLSKTAYLDAPGTTMNRLYLAYLPLLTVPQEVFCYGAAGRLNWRCLQAGGRLEKTDRPSPALGIKRSSWRTATAPRGVPSAGSRSGSRPSGRRSGWRP